jgi:hypothetical protein
MGMGNRPDTAVLELLEPGRTTGDYLLDAENNFLKEELGLEAYLGRTVQLSASVFWVGYS